RGKGPPGIYRGKSCFADNLLDARGALMIEKRPNGKYRVRVYSGGRYLASRTSRRLVDARGWEREQQDALAAGDWVKPDAKQLSLDEWLEVWSGTRRSKVQSQKREDQLIRTHISPEFGRRPMSGLAPSEISRWAMAVASNMSPSTARQALGVVRRAYDLAVRDGIVRRNPATGIKLPRSRPNEPRPLTHGEVWSLVSELPSEQDRALVLVLAYCGLRWGEAIAVTPERIRPDGIRVVQSIPANSRGLPEEVKTWANRTVPVPATVRQRLEVVLRSRLPGRFVFHNADGKALWYRNWRTRVFDPAVERSGLDITVHNLRDTAASLAIAAGASVVAVARLLGHENGATTLRHYAGLFPSDLDKVATALDRHARRAAKRYDD